MKNIVLYCTRTGNSGRLAGIIANDLKCDKLQITDNISWKGIIGFMKGGFYSLTGRTTLAEVEGNPAFAEFDNVVMVAPLWAGGIAPAAYSLLQKEIGNIRKLTLLINCDGSKPDKAFQKLEDMIGPYNGRYCVVKSLNNEEEVIKALVNDVMGNK